MQKRVIQFFGLSTLLWILAAMLPLSASAATVSQTHVPHFFVQPSQQGLAKTLPAAGSNLIYNGGPVQDGTANVYAIFWEPTGNVQSGYNSLIQRYFNDVNGSGLYANNTQYHGASSSLHPTGERLAGSWVDTRAYPRSPLLDTDIQGEVSHAKSATGWVSSVHNIFFVFLQKSENLCFDSSRTQCASNYFCAYHNYFGSNTIYASMPYAASFRCNPGSSPNGNDADQTINVTSHEQMEAATDPLLNAWYDSSQAEIGDKCAWNFGPKNSSGGDVTYNGHSYILQKEWDNKKSGCVLTGP